MPEGEQKSGITIHLDPWKILTLVTFVLLLINIFFTYGNNQMLVGMKETLNSLTGNTGNNNNNGNTRVTVSPGDTPAKGAVNAKVTIIEFSDYQCSYCGAVEPTIEQILQNYPNDVKLYYRNFPLTQLHPDAMNAAMAAECANEQGKFWEMHNKLFANQGALGVTNLKQYASDLGLDTAKFNSCLDSNKYSSQIAKDQQDGNTAGVSGTPAFFINGLPLVGAQPFSVFQQAINSELAA